MTWTPPPTLVEELAKAMFVSDNVCTAHDWFNANEQARENFRHFVQAILPIIARVVEDQRNLAKANNDLARMYKAQADELRGKCVVLADTLDYIAPSLPVLRDMLKWAKMPRGANQASEMAKVCEAALKQYRCTTVASQAIEACVSGWEVDDANP